MTTTRSALGAATVLWLGACGSSAEPSAAPETTVVEVRHAADLVMDVTMISQALGCPRDGDEGCAVIAALDTGTSVAPPAQRAWSYVGPLRCDGGVAANTVSGRLRLAPPSAAGGDLSAEITYEQVFSDADDATRAQRTSDLLAALRAGQAPSQTMGDYEWVTHVPVWNGMLSQIASRNGAWYRIPGVGAFSVQPDGSIAVAATFPHPSGTPLHCAGTLVRGGDAPLTDTEPVECAGLGVTDTDVTFSACDDSVTRDLGCAEGETTCACRENDTEVSTFPRPASLTRGDLLRMAWENCHWNVEH